MTDAQERRLAAKRHNESIKLAATAVSTLGVSGVVGGVVVPFINTPASDEPPNHWVWFCVGVGLHIVAQLILEQMRSEE